MEIKQLSAFYGKKQILQHLSFDLKEGRITVLLGKNGSGKTTLLKCLSDLLEIKQGNILINKRDFSSYSKTEKAKLLTYLPQVLPSPAISVSDLLHLGRYPFTNEGRKKDEEEERKIALAIKKAGMENFSSKLVCHLSGGEKEFAYLAMMLAKDSPYDFLDEPFASLDITHQKTLASLLKQMKKEGKSILVSVHDLILALDLADDVLLLDQGKQIFFGIKEEFLASKIYESTLNSVLVPVKDNQGNDYFVLKEKEEAISSSLTD